MSMHCINHSLQLILHPLLVDEIISLQLLLYRLLRLVRPHCERSNRSAILLRQTRRLGSDPRRESSYFSIDF